MSHPRPALLLDFANTGWLPPGVTLRRNQPSGARTAWQDGNGIWRIVPAHAPRWLHDAAAAGRRLGLSLGEAARTNSNPNQLGEGLVAGAPGTAPTGTSMTLDTTTNGLSRNIIGLQTFDGIPCIVVEVSGTATAATNFDIVDSAPSAIVAANGQTWVTSRFVRLISGSLTGIITRQVWSEWTAGGALVTNANGALVTLTTALQRVPGDVRTIPNATTERIQTRWRTNIASGTNLTTPLRFAVGWAQTEMGATASPPIAPAAGSTGASTREAEVLSVDLARFGLANLADLSLLVAARTGTPNTAAQTLAQLVGGAGDSITLRRTAGGLLQLDVLDDGVSQAAINDGVAVAAGADVVALLSAAANSFTLTRNGAAEAADAAGTVPGFTTLRLGSADTDIEPAGMALARVALWSRQIPAAARLAYAS